ncbi:MAG: NCS2 family permease [Nitrospirae bacterium]|nr:NCS2 family permease [Nitrospirota bacterium]MBF0541905.1 NCS2 family permease [Nitrospirota bacterium]
MKKYFDFNKYDTTYLKEFIGGFTSFAATAYIIIVNPAILSAAGIPKGASIVATILTAVFGTLIMGIYAKRPYIIAPYMGENAFIAYTVCGVLHYSWQTALGAIFISGVLFVILTLSGARRFIVESVPYSLKASFSVGIGLFLCFIGLNLTQIVRLGVSGAPVTFGHITSLNVLIAIFGVIITAVFVARDIKAGLLLGIIITSIAAFITHAAPVPCGIFSMPPDIRSILFKLDIAGALTWGCVSVVLTIFVLAFVDTMGTLIGMASISGILDKDGNMPEIEKPMLADALSTVFAPLVGSTTAGCFIETAAGIKAGASTGFAAIVTASFFILALFFAPILTAIPPEAYGPALIIVGFFMLKPFKNIDIEDLTEFFPSVITIALMSFTFNIGIGMTAGFVLYPILKIASGRGREIKPGMYILFILSLLFYIFYPY